MKCFLMYWMWTVILLLPGLIDNSIGKCRVIYSVSTTKVITLLAVRVLYKCTILDQNLK